MHHANLLVGEIEWALGNIPESDKQIGPDVSVTHYERMNIAQVRTLIYEAGLRPVSRPHRTFILMCDSMLPESQNALLKLFEEPNEHTRFYLIIPREDMLLPTLRSRLHLMEKQERVLNDRDFVTFSKLGYAERLTTIAEKVKSEDTKWMFAVMSGFSEYAHRSHDSILMREAMLIESYMHTVGSSTKMLLEHLALTLDPS